MNGRDGLMTTCNVHFRGIKLYYGIDEGNGGGMWFDRTDRKNEAHTLLEKELNESIKKLPEEYIKEYDFWSKIDLETLVNEIADEMELAKVIKRHGKKGIVYENGDSMKVIGWKSPLVDIAKTPNGLSVIQREYDKVKNSGKQILNASQLQNIGVRV